MSEVKEITVNVDEYLALDKYEVDEESAHIELVDDPDTEEFLKLVRVCPAALWASRLRGLRGGGPLPHRLRGHHRQEVGEPPAHDGRGVPVRVGGEQHARNVQYHPPSPTSGDGA